MIVDCTHYLDGSRQSDRTISLDEAVGWDPDPVRAGHCRILPAGRPNAQRQLRIHTVAGPATPSGSASMALSSV